MRKVISVLIFLCAFAVGQTGLHRKVFSSTPPAINCSTFPSAGIIESHTDGRIDFSSQPTVTFTSTMQRGDILFALGANNSGTAVLLPVISDSDTLSWNNVIVQANQAEWYAVVPSTITGDVITVAFNPQSGNRSLTIALIRQAGTFTTGNNTGPYPGTDPNFTVNASLFAFNFNSAAPSSWIFGGIVFPSTGTFLHSLVIAGAVSYNGTTFTGGLYPPVNWTEIIHAGLPSASIVYSCSFP